MLTLSSLYTNSSVSSRSSKLAQRLYNQTLPLEKSQHKYWVTCTLSTIAMLISLVISIYSSKSSAAVNVREIPNHICLRLRGCTKWGIHRLKKSLASSVFSDT